MPSAIARRRPKARDDGFSKVRQGDLLRFELNHDTGYVNVTRARFEALLVRLAGAGRDARN